MARIILVHGAWHGGWCWHETARALRAAGHRVETPDLPGAGDDPTPAAGITLARYRDSIAPGPDKTVLVGHSMGGMVISALAQSQPDRIAALVYLCAYLPRPGDSLAMLERLNPAPRPAWPRDAAGLCLPPPPPDRAQALFYHDCPPEIAAGACAKLRPQPIAPLRDRLSMEPLPPLPRHYLLCQQDRAIPAAFQHAMIARAPGIEVRPMEAGHSPFLSAPGILARHIDRIATP